MKKFFAIVFSLQLMLLPMRAHAIIGGMSQITGIGIASVGVSLIASCALKTPSIMIYAAGAAAYLMGEMNAAKAHKDNTKKQEEETKRLEESGLRGGELQKASIEAQIKQKEEDLKLANKRKMWTMAAAAVFTAAAAMSALEIPPFVPPAGCISTTAAQIGLPLGAGIAGAYGLMSGGGLMKALMGAIGGAVAVQSAVVSAFNVGPTRSIAMGVVAGLTMMSAMEAGSAASKLQKEVNDLKKLLAQFKAETDGQGPNTEDTTAGVSSGADAGGGLAGVTSGSTSGAASGSGSPITLLPNGTNVSGTTTCLSASNELGSNCSNSMKFSSPDLRILGNMPELQQASNQAVEFANAATSGNTGKADVAAASLASMAGKTSEILKKNRDAQNKKLVAAGKKAIDYDKEEKDMLKSMQSAYQKETASQQPQLAAFGLDSMSLEPSKADGSGQNVASASVDAAVAVPTSKADAAQAITEFPTVPESASANAAKNNASESATDALGAGLNDYESAENDISKDSGESLWRQVSNRYLLNYNRFFERKKIDEKAPAQ